jgi:hypothetical protein
VTSIQGSVSGVDGESESLDGSERLTIDWRKGCELGDRVISEFSVLRRGSALGSSGIRLSGWDVADTGALFLSLCACWSTTDAIRTDGEEEAARAYPTISRVFVSYCRKHSFNRPWPRVRDLCWRDNNIKE